MANSQTLNITLSDAVIEFVRNKVSNGEYATESDAINESLETLMQESEEQARWEREVLVPSLQGETERWLHEVGAVRYDSAHADPSSLIPLEEVVKKLEERRRQRAKARA